MRKLINYQEYESLLTGIRTKVSEEAEYLYFKVIEGWLNDNVFNMTDEEIEMNIKSESNEKRVKAKIYKLKKEYFNKITKG